ncbi:hypothetical protein [Acinetobacter gandensis]|uniref:hypothetical protein n=1 Tax=Acinetobacter gandensis TaxID=1443941 RepID=UPI00398A00E9
MKGNSAKPQREQHLQETALQIIRISPVLEQLYQEQLAIVGAINAQNLFKIDSTAHKVSVLNGCCEIQFQSTKSLSAQFPRSPIKPIKIASFYSQYPQFEALEDFFLHDIYFLTGDLKPQHSLFLRNKAQQLRTLIFEHVYVWLDGAERISNFISQMSLVQAEIIDQLMMRQNCYQHDVMRDYVQTQQPIPKQVVTLFQQMFCLSYLDDPTLLSIQSLMDSYDEFCFSAAQFLDADIYRIMTLAYPERFNLNELNEHVDDIILLMDHVHERPNLLGFIRLMQRDAWHKQDLLSQAHFLNHNSVWQKKVGKLPILDSKRAVKWLFKQPALVSDWLSQHFQHSSVRVAMTALSFVDTSRIHPTVILSTLQYFQFIAVKLFIQRCFAQALDQGWFEAKENTQFILKDRQNKTDDHRIAISPSILYLDEWLLFMRQSVGLNDLAIKKVYQPLSRMMQAYMLYLNECIATLPTALVPYIRVEMQENRDFINQLHHHKIQLHDFRQLFYLKSNHTRVTVFDAYVRDYISAVFTGQYIAKNISWKGLFYQAVRWHDTIQKQEIINKLKKEYDTIIWPSLSPQSILVFEGWAFEELSSITRIIEESKRCRHCLAMSYSNKIVEGEYVAFHVSQLETQQHMTLGCAIQQHELIFDQLEYPDNTPASPEVIEVAKKFIQWFNSIKQK